MLKILVDAKNLQYLNRFASKEPTRYWLKGIYFAPNFDLVATDGHRLGRLANGYMLASDSEAPAMWTDIKGLALNTRGDKITEAAIKRLKGEVTITADVVPDGAGYDFKNIVAGDRYGQSVALCEIDASYPEYKKVIPESTGATDSNKVAFNPSYMADFAGYEKNDRLQIEIHDETAPILVKNSALDNFTGVLMPVRWDAVAQK